MDTLSTHRDDLRVLLDRYLLPDLRRLRRYSQTKRAQAPAYIR
jgi:hypothetical protein